MNKYEKIRKEKRRFARRVLHENNRFLFRAFIEQIREKKGRL